MAFFQDVIMPMSENEFFQIMLITTIDYRKLNNGQMDTGTILSNAT